MAYDLWYGNTQVQLSILWRIAKILPEINAVWTHSRIGLLNALLFYLILWFCASAWATHTLTHTHTYVYVWSPAGQSTQIIFGRRRRSENERSSYKDKYQQASKADRQSVCVC